MKPVVLVIHEIFGISEHIRDMCGRLDQEGFAASAVDMYAHLGSPVLPASQLEEAFAYRRQVSDEQAMAYVRAAAASARPTPVGIIGFCFGGRVAHMAAWSGIPDIRAAVACYGSAVDRPPVGTPAPVLSIFGGHDEYYGAERIQAVRDALAAAGPANQVLFYPDAGHGFFDATHPKRHHAASAADAWPKLVTFLRGHLA